jgi:ADP-heptose:LPS heptosyltransferase
MVADFKNKDRGLRRIVAIGRSLRQKNFDIVIDLQNNRKSHILSFLSRSINRYGYDNKKLGRLLNNRELPCSFRNAVERTSSQVRMRDLTAAKDDGDFDLVPLVQEFQNVLELELEIMLVGGGSHLDALHFDGFFAGQIELPQDSQHLGDFRR